MSVNRWIIAVGMRVRSLVRRDAAERDLDDELRFHVEQVTADYVARGLSPDAARRAALLSIGGIVQRKDECREVRGLGVLRSATRDLALGMRLLRRDAAFSAVVVATLAAGIGATLAVISVANTLLLRPLPGIADASSLVAIRLDRPGLESPSSMSIEDVQLLSEGSPALQALTGIQGLPANVSVAVPGENARRVAVDFVMANYFDVVRTAVTGRVFTADEERTTGAPAVAIVSERLARALGRDALLGETVVINGKDAVVAGIARDGFRGTGRLTPVDLWMPLAQRWTALPSGAEPPARLGPPAAVMWGLIGRLSPGASVPVLQAQIDAVEQQIAASLLPSSRRFETRHFRAVETLEWFPAARVDLARLLRALVSAAGLLLLLACANVSNAMLARSTARAGELATRMALGASWLSLARALFTEGLVLSLTAGVLGLGLAALAATLLDGTTLLASLPPLERPGFDGLVVLSGIGLCALVAVGTSLAPMWSVRHSDVAAALQRSSRSVSAGRRRMTQGLLAVQVAISVVLLIGATLFVRSINAKLRIDVGVEKARVQTFRLDPRRPTGQAAHAFHEDLVERLRSLPGVTATSVAFLPPFYSGNEARLAFRADGAPDGADQTVMLNAVYPGFFDAIGLPIVAGRDFVEGEFTSPADRSPLILGESVARRVFGTADVVGRVAVTSTGARRPVVGVVRDSRQRQLTSDDSMDLAFQPYRVDYTTPFITGIVRTSTAAINVWPEVRQALAAMDPSLVMFEAKSVDEGIRSEFGHEILTMRLALVFGGVAVFLAGIGLASVMARALADRRRELGIRSALGATPARLAALIGGESAVVLLVGVVTGTTATLWLTRYIESRLFGVSRLDPVSFVAAIAAVVVVMAIISLPVCRRAAHADPAGLLKEQ